ncbi:acyltransferase domain-containing protein [Labrys sp. KB_33_2]|uniref:acyltransferase domain-containing protein n=1 Tax=Labrys sp. KB_33_2 TaxID=3237479 RepID=UPI003F919B52
MRRAFLFPGQGAFYSNAHQMIRSAYLEVEVALVPCERVALERFGRSLVDAMSQPGDASAFVKQDPDLLQLAIYAISVAAHAALRAESVEADVMVGHSFGEIAALTCAGAYTIEQGANIVCDRVEALAQSAPADGCMAAVMAKSDVVSGLLNEWAQARNRFSMLPVIAVENHDRQTVVSGLEADLLDFVGFCIARKTSAQRLHSPYSFHHPSLADAQRNFAKRLEAYTAGSLGMPVYSPILGRPYTKGDDLGECLAQHLVMPVRFSAAIHTLHRAGASVFIECGALDALSKIVTRNLGKGSATIFASLPSLDRELSAIADISRLQYEGKTMPTSSYQDKISSFDTFLQHNSQSIMSYLRSEYEKFLAQQSFPAPQRVAGSPLVVEAALLAAPPSTPTLMAVAMPQAAGGAISRAKLFDELAEIYATAMEYPREVFNETVELEAELGIDSVKQTEIMGRIALTYGLSPLPTNIRMSDYKTMGQIVDFVHSRQSKAA